MFDLEHPPGGRWIIDYTRHESRHCSENIVNFCQKVTTSTFYSVTSFQLSCIMKVLLNAAHIIPRYYRAATAVKSRALSENDLRKMLVLV